MTHPSTPAADAAAPYAARHPLEAYAVSYDMMSRMGDGKVSAHAVAIDIRGNMIRAAATREAALIAERDQLRAALVSIRDRLLACSEMPISAAEAFDSFYQSDVEQALALSAPAVGVE